MIDNEQKDENRSTVWNLLDLVEIKCTNFHRIIEDGKVNIPTIRGVIPTTIALIKLLFHILYAFASVLLTILVGLLSIMYVVIKETVVLSLVIVIGVISILFAIIGVNIQAAMLNSLLGKRKE